MKNASENTIDRLVATLLTNADSRGRIKSRQIAQDAVYEILRPLTRRETMGWLLSPGHRESARSYARKAYEVAAGRHAWCGGLADGAPVAADDAARASAQWLVSR